MQQLIIIMEDSNNFLLFKISMD